MYVGGWTIKQLAQRVPKEDTICVLTLHKRKEYYLQPCMFVSLLSLREILPFQQWMFQHSTVPFYKDFHISTPSTWVVTYPHACPSQLQLPLPHSELKSSQNHKQIKEVGKEKNMSTIYSLQPRLRGCTVCYWGEEGRKTLAHVMSTLNAHTEKSSVKKKKQETRGRNLIRGPQRQNYLKTEGLERIKGQ